MTTRTGRPIPFFIGAIAALTWETFISVLKRERLISIVPRPLLKRGAARAFISIGALMFFANHHISGNVESCLRTWAMLI